MSKPQTNCLGCETPTPKALCDACYIETVDKQFNLLRANCERLEGENSSLRSENEMLKERLALREEIMVEANKKLREALEECKKWATDPYKAPELIPQLVIETVDAALAGTDAKGER